jgi:hypothetical protein
MHDPHRPEGLLSPRQMADIVYRNEQTPTPLWQLAKSAGVSEKSLLYILGRRGFDVSYDDKGTAHVSKSDVRKLMSLEGEL